MSKLQNEFPAEFPPSRIEKAVESRTCSNVLYVPRIEVIEEIENAKTDSRVQVMIAKRQSNPPGDLKVE
jgi:hypothetical protein